VSAPERAALRSLLGVGLEDVFRRFDQPDGAYSWWDYRAAAFRRNHGLRIDLVLASPRLAACCTACRIDREPRTWERPSDHAPVLATFDFPPLMSHPG
jgi:exodeoxyribonuclease-3